MHSWLAGSDLGSVQGVDDDLALAEEALAIARQLDDPALLTRALSACAAITAHDIELARPYFDEAIELARSLGDSWRLSQILGRRTFGAFLASDVDTLKSVAEEGYNVAEAIGDHFNSRQCRWCLITALYYRGDVAIATNMLRDFVAEATTAHDLMSRMTGLLIQSHVLAMHGDTDGARAAASGTLEASAEFGGIFDHAAYATAAVAYLADGEFDAAWEAVQTAVRHSMFPPAEGMNTVMLAQVALACRQLSTARAWADQALATTNGIWSSWALTTRAHVHFSEGEQELAADDAYEALAITADAGAYLAVPDIFECLVRASCAAGGSREAVRLLGAAHSMRQQMGYVWYQFPVAEYDALKVTLREKLGDNDFDAAWAEGAALSTEEAIAYAQRGRGERKRPSTGWASLTPTELDVVRLVVDGLPNKDIATRLFVSPRTVQSHLRHVYNKLGLTSRVQLAQEAARHTRAPT
jgi:DNA-binding CsgD family transcriptional regulator